MSISLLFSILLLLLFHLRIEVGLVTTISRQVKSESKSNLLKLFNLQPANIIPISSFKKPSKSKLSARPVFAKVNRYNGQLLWMRELYLMIQGVELQNFKNDMSPFNARASIGTMIEVSKMLVYSGVPDQALELYAAYYDCVVNKQFNALNTDTFISNSTLFPPVIPDPKFILVTVRAFIRNNDVFGAVKLLQACSHAQVQFDLESKSLLIADLALSGSTGLQAALKLGQSMKVLNERISAHAYASLIRGITFHGFTPHKHEKLLVDPLSLENDGDDDEFGTTFRLTCSQAEELVTSLYNDYEESRLKKCSTTVSIADSTAGISKSNSGQTIVSTSSYSAFKKVRRVNRSSKVLCERLRLAFRLATKRSKVLYDSNFDVDNDRFENCKLADGFKEVIGIMSKQQVSWSLPIVETLLEECLQIGHIDGIDFLVSKMKKHKLYAETSTFNTLLKRYADNGDCESAYTLVYEIMVPSSMCQPNDDTWILLLRSCIQTHKGRYYANQIIHDLESSKKLTKDLWDKKIQLDIYSSKSYVNTLWAMLQANIQPDDETILCIIETSSRMNRIESIIQLYNLQSRSELNRRQLRLNIAASPNPLSAISALQEEYTKCAGSNLQQLPSSPELLTTTSVEEIIIDEIPPPSQRTVHAMLKVFRDRQEYGLSSTILDDMCSRAQFDVDSKITSSKLSHISQVQLAELNGLISDIAIRENSTERKYISSILPVSLTLSGYAILNEQLSPNLETFALVIESCVDAKNFDSALSVLEIMEKKAGLKPDRRIYAALIEGFGSRNDIPSAFGVFNEMKKSFTPDVETLNSILKVCVNEPGHIRQAALFLEELVDEEYELEIYSKDVLMQSFPNSGTLGAVFEKMVYSCKALQLLNPSIEIIKASMPVISCLVQSLRNSTGLGEIISSMEYLGFIGIQPESSTLDYFRMAETPKLNSPNSRHYNRKLLPNVERQRELIRDIKIPTDIAPDLSLPFDRVRDFKLRTNQNEPYFDPTRNVWLPHVNMLKQTMLEKADENGNFDSEDDSDIDCNDDHENYLAEAEFEREVLNFLSSRGDVSVNETGPKSNAIGEYYVLIDDTILARNSGVVNPNEAIENNSINSTKQLRSDQNRSELPSVFVDYELRSLFSGQQRPMKIPGSDIWLPNGKARKDGMKGSPKRSSATISKSSEAKPYNDSKQQVRSQLNPSVKSSDN